MIEPDQSNFASFNGRGEIAGNLTKLGAQELSVAMEFGPLPIRLTLLRGPHRSGISSVVDLDGTRRRVTAAGSL